MIATHSRSQILSTSKNPVTWFLCVALAFVLVNLWVYLLWFFVNWAQPGESIPAEAKAGIVDYWIVDVNTR